jgi:hypothetical protein
MTQTDHPAHVPSCEVLRQIGKTLLMLRETYTRGDTSLYSQEHSFHSVARNLPEFVQRLNVAGYPVSLSDYQTIEAGECLPSDIGSFVTALSQCLGLSPEDQLALLEKLAFAVLVEELGEDLALCITRSWKRVEWTHRP